MKVECSACGTSFKVKGELPKGKAFRFKCPKCGHVNKIYAEEILPPPPKPKVSCEDCGEMIPEPKEGEPKLCDQCKASRAVKEAQKLRIQAESSPLPEGVEFREDLFASEEEAKEEPEEKLEAKPAEKEEETLPDIEAPPSSTAENVQEVAEEKTKAEEKIEPPPPPARREEVEEEEEEVIIGAPPPPVMKPATPESTYRVRSADGLIIGPIKLATLRDLIVAKKIHRDEEFSRDDGPYMGLAEFPELFEIFQSQPVKQAEKEEEEIVDEELKRVKMSKDKILSMLKVKKKCAGCGEEIFVIEEVENPLCDQCRIEALVAKKKLAKDKSEPLYRVRSPDGLVLGPLKKSTIEDLIVANNIRGVEEVSVADGPWRPIMEVEELAPLFNQPAEEIIDLTELADG